MTARVNKLEEKANGAQSDPFVSVAITDSNGNVGPVIRDAAPCFTTGTKIVTFNGEIQIEDIKIGDKVLTADNGFQKVRWIGRRHVTADELRQFPQLRPVVIAKGAFGNSRDIKVSPQHGMVRRVDGAEQLIRARYVSDYLGSDFSWLDMDCDETTYFHIMFDQHELIFAEGAMTEAFFPGPSAVASLDHAARVELLHLFPELADVWTKLRTPSAVFGNAARQYLAPQAGAEDMRLAS